MAYPTTYVRAASPPSGGPTPGAKALMAGILAHFPATNLGIYNPRDVCGNPWPNFKCSPSQHATGRACDFGIPDPLRPTVGDRIAQHLVTHCTALGITEVIWHRRRWTKTGGWVAYSGRSPHLDHVHTTLHPDAAARLTRAEVDATFTATPKPTPPEDDLSEAADRIEAALLDVANRLERLERRLVRQVADEEGTVWLTDGMTRVWVPDEQWRLRLAEAFRFGAPEKWAAADLAKIPLVGWAPPTTPTP